MNKTLERSFIVMPSHCNSSLPLIFGGAFMSELDITAAQLINRYIQENENSPAISSVTHKAEFEFVKPSYMGDTIEIYAEITETRHKAIVAVVKAYRIPPKIKNPDKVFVASAKFVFVAIDENNGYIEHKL